MLNKRIVIFIFLIILCLWIIISEILSWNEKHPEADNFTKTSIKINGRTAFICAIIGLIILIYLIFSI
mgnify:CR=1 FL=1